MSATRLHEGHCRCGAIAMRAEATPDFSAWCHCEDCRRQNGAPAVAFVGFPASAVEWQGEPRRYRHSSGLPVDRLFCGECGAPVGYHDQRIAERMFFYTGFMNAPETYPPKAHSHAGQAMPWFFMEDGLPRTDKTLVERP